MITHTVRSCDVLILGAGPAGCATAIGLMSAGVERVLLVDKPLSVPFRIGESATPDVSTLLAELGLESDLARMGHLPYHGNLSLWGGDQPRLDHFLSRGHGHGWHLDRSAFDAWLKREATGHGATLVTPSAIDALAPAADGWKLAVRGVGEVRARVIVDAAGRRSPLASKLGAKRCRIDSLVAIAACLPSASGLDGLSLVESFSDGWWYATRLPDGRALVTLMTDADIAKSNGFAEADAFERALGATRLLAGHIEPQPASFHPSTFAAHSGYAQRAAGHNWIAVGDALMGLDPLTSSGISGALNDALAAVPAIKGLLAGDSAPARTYTQRADSTFGRYLAERRKHYAAERLWQDRPFWQRRSGHDLRVQSHPAVASALSNDGAGKDMSRPAIEQQ